jgi:PilZ domain
MRRVNGVLASVDTPIFVHDLSRTGFAVVSRIIFEPGETLDFRLVADDGMEVRVTAQAVHTRPFDRKPGLHLSGFEFVAGTSGFVPHVQIDRLIEAVTPFVSHF